MRADLYLREGVLRELVRHGLYSAGHLQRFKLLFFGVAAVLATGYGAIWVWGDLTLSVMREIWVFVFIGVGGAVVANSTGVGGGVVFIPAFNIVRDQGVIALDMAQIVGISFLIQCFGMSVGSLTWIRKIYSSDNGRPATGIEPAEFWKLIAVVLAFTVPMLWLSQTLLQFQPREILLAFKGFSITLGLALLVTTWTVNRSRPERDHLSRNDIFVLAVIGLAGGVVTAVFSVGVGELMALYLFIRHYPLNTCVATAVITSAVTVIMGAPHHILATNIPWEVVALAVPGAMLGGFLARRFAHFLGARILKTFAALWIVGSSLYLILLNV